MGLNGTVTHQAGNDTELFVVFVLVVFLVALFDELGIDPLQLILVCYSGKELFAVFFNDLEDADLQLLFRFVIASRG